MNKLDQTGLTIVELLVTIAVAAVVITTMTEVTTNFLHTAQRGRYLNLANSFAEGEIEALRNQGYNSLSLGTSSLTSSLPSELPPKSTSSMTVTDPNDPSTGSPIAGIKQVQITVTYADQGQSNTYTYTSFIGELGVGQ